MRTQSWLFLIIGFAIGFAGLYTWTKQRAPEVVRATPLAVDPNVPTESLNRAAESAPPPLDTARFEELQAKVKSNPKDFDSLVELGNMKNPADSALMKTPEGRQKYADAVVRGIAGFLGSS